MVPTGSYSPTRLANPGVNYYGFIPNAGVTWFSRPGWELSAMAALQINTRNKDTDYTSGTIASLEYLVGFNVTKTLQLGVQGFYLQQISDDKVAGQSYEDGLRGRALALGPQVRYEFAPGCGLTFKHQREFDVRNRADGNRFWLEASFPFK
ncbi:transporter [Paraburkholderia sediminicola]